MKFGHWRWANIEAGTIGDAVHPGPQRGTLVAFAIVSALFFACVASAATITVGTTADERNTNGQCSLREAIINANADNQSGSPDCLAGSGADTILLQSGATYVLSRDANNGDENAADEDDLDVTSTVTISGNNATVARDTNLDCSLNGGSLAGEFRIFHVHATGNLTVQDMTVQFGCADGSGGGEPTGGGFLVDVGGTLTAVNSTITQNQASAEGGGIESKGSVNVQNSAVTDNASGSNVTAGIGGGILSGQGGRLQLSDSIVSGNAAVGSLSVGGGIWNAGEATVLRSILANNSAFGGAAIYNSGEITAVNITVSGNAAFSSAVFNDTNGVIALSFATVTNNSSSQSGSAAVSNVASATNFSIRNSIVGNQSLGDNCSGSLTASGVNFDTDGTCSSFTQVSSAALNLGPLANNGGPTDTHALLAGSVAINAVPSGQCTDVDNNVVTTDQRGVVRPQGLQCDAGAYETRRAGAAPAPAASGVFLAAMAVALALLGLRSLLRRQAP
ncbi:MAG: hypothetical protein KatS3mg077_1941 [Candidatus Binatia bacterium]|nr:MAG: hypothetical protein KatS3mg077_1941 [Candidatus Binatia bacterium]